MLAVMTEPLPHQLHTNAATELRFQIHYFLPELPRYFLAMFRTIGVTIGASTA